MLRTNQQQPCELLLTLKRNLERLDQVYPDLVWDKRVRYGWSCFTSFALMVAMCYVLNGFFDVGIIIALLTAAGIGCGLLVLDVNILWDRFRAVQRWTAARIITLVLRFVLMLSILGSTAIFISATKLDSSASNYLADKELAYIESKKNEAGYQRLLKREIELIENRKNIKADLSTFKKEESALQTDIDRRRWQLNAEAKGTTYVIDGKEIGSGNPNNLQNPAANKEWNKMNAIQQERNAELRGVMSQIDRLKGELRDVNTELKGVQSQKENFIANAKLEAGVKHEDLAINKAGALVDMVAQKGPRRVEAVMTMAFIFIVVLFIDFVQLCILYLPSRRDEEHEMCSRTLTAMRMACVGSYGEQAAQGFLNHVPAPSSARVVSNAPANLWQSTGPSGILVGGSRNGTGNGTENNASSGAGNDVSNGDGTSASNGVGTVASNDAGDSTGNRTGNGASNGIGNVASNGAGNGTSNGVGTVASNGAGNGASNSSSNGAGNGTSRGVGNVANNDTGDGSDRSAEEELDA